jgi:hypothetical protein
MRNGAQQKEIEGYLITLASAEIGDSYMVVRTVL